ncbi:MAG: hypothetical protein P4L33_12485 [Capsulimonadaceae bacterium]|nr:hypothetical protein [Capsulimonadaceae bacterium]
MDLKALILVGTSLAIMSPVQAQTLQSGAVLTAIGAAEATPSQEIVVPAAPAPATETPVVRSSGSRRLRVGPELGLFVPTRNLVRNRFGTNWFSFGVGLGQYTTAPETGQWTFDISLLSNASGGNAAYLLPLGAEYRLGLAANRSAVPYVAAEGDYVPSDVRSQTDNVNWGIRSAWGGALLAGIDFGSDARIEAGYRWISDIIGYNFSGAVISAGFRF